jgi:hypothetical protein
MATLEIFLSEPVHTAQPESVGVKVDGAPAGASVEVTLTQVQGKAPFWGPLKKTVTADASGSAFATFSVTFSGPTPSATVMAQASDSEATYYGPDAHSVEVLP